MKGRRTLIILLAVVAACGAFTVFDVVRAQTYYIEVQEISPEKPVADVRQQVQITLKLTKYGKPVSGHSLFVLAKNGGMMKGSRAITDENGLAVFTYIPYTATTLQPARAVTISVIDESNSVFVEINAKLDFIIDLQPKPKEKAAA